MKTYIGIDNGVSGNITAIQPDGTITYHPTPVVEQLDYTKKARWIHRIDTSALEALLTQLAPYPDHTLVVMERPAINAPGDNATPEVVRRFWTTISAARSFEATLIVLERLRLPYQVVDSRNWQKVMLPDCGVGQTKRVAREVAKKLFPAVTDAHADPDSLLMAEWAKRAAL